MSIRQTVLDQLFFGRDPLKDFPAGKYATDLQGWHSQHSYLARAIEEARPRIVVEVGVWKGASVVTLLHRDTLQPLGSAPVSARETLLVRYSTRHPYFLLVGLESSGRAQTLIGDAEQRSLAIEPGNGAVLGTGVQLDEYEGAELWVAILSSEPVDAAPLIVELQSRHRGLPQGVELGGLMASPLPADGEQMFWVLTKVPR